MKKQKDQKAAQIKNAQLTLVESALIEFIEALLGRVPSEDEILAKSLHVTFAPNPLSVYEHEGKRFSQYWVWDAAHVVALGFLDPKDPLCLYVAEVPREAWPTALKLLVGNRKGET